MVHTSRRWSVIELTDPWEFVVFNDVPASRTAVTNNGIGHGQYPRLATYWPWTANT